MANLHKFTAADIDLLNRLMESQPAFLEYASLAKQILANTTFPIHSFDDLSAAVTKSGGVFTFRGKPMGVEQVRELVPAYYFPISSENDLFAKIKELQRQSGTRSGGGGTPTTDPGNPATAWAANQIPMPAGVPPRPQVDQQEIVKLARAGGKSAGIANIA